LSAPTVQQILAANGVNGSVVHAAVWLDDDVSPEHAREAAIEAAQGIDRLAGGDGAARTPGAVDAGRGGAGSVRRGGAPL